MERRIGIDTGGTFTDCVLVDQVAGKTFVEKVPSRPDHPEEAMLDGIIRLLDKAGLSPQDVDAVVHGTTIATNMVIEETFAPAGVLATSGCRDVIEVATQQRTQPYELLHPPKQVLIPRNHRHEVSGRIAAGGEVVNGLDEDAARQAVRRMREDGVRSFAVTGVFSFVNPAHERRLVEIIDEEAPEAYAVASSSISREAREYPRFATTAINAALAPRLDPYIRGLLERLKDSDFRAHLLIMQSSGGIATASRCMGERAHHLVLSGPAAAVVGAQNVCETVGIDNLVTLDVGGTSADIAIISNGDVRVGFEMKLPGGMPLHVPNIQIETIGAGGGSIAWVDTGGALQVGPRSAGADPGPACFRKGGTAPTVTDAQLVLNRLGPSGLIGGGLKLDRDAAIAAVGEIAQKLSVTVEQAAHGIVSVMEANMAGAIQRTATSYGEDLREYALLAAGGAGGLGVCSVADSLGIPKVVIPPHPGLLSAAGLLRSELRHDISEPMLIDVEVANPSDISAVHCKLEGEMLSDLTEDGLRQEQCRFENALDLRYFGQEYAVTLKVLPDEDISEIVKRFHAQHERLYGYSAPGSRVEITAVRCVGIGMVASASAPRAESAARTMPPSVRKVWFESAHDYVDTMIVHRSELSSGMTIQGPAIIEQFDTTTVIPPCWIGHYDENDYIILERTK
ncbi:hydantoinase/oxoprolinase family protein [Sinorhizobium sp. BG8]|uniref:hydantoinase/oxoprolinase family protein n=1 Tax=Sinorhizobium sp. BG8 TaxID=2613773 RepID=UPI00193D9DBB|nr:hydantoinase/oxoprolinase family protein [Sinorhizobium sp. BG8]QRM57088.1 hydantoinase/oxoprolinase family protein [Sinorhizobium sp. BG8]